MFKHRLTQSDIFLIAANIIPVIGVWGWGWEPKDVFLVYCLETIIMGLLTLTKMLMASIYRKTDSWPKNGKQTMVPGIFFMVFFIFHYGMFVAIQMAIFFGVSGIGSDLHLNVFNFFYKWPQLVNDDTIIMLAVFLFCYVYKMLVEFVFTKQYQTTPMMVLMLQPYIRIFIQQITVIFGSMFLVFGAGKIFILIFAGVKTYFEIFINYDSIMNKATNQIEEQRTGGD